MQNKTHPRRFVVVGDVHGQIGPFLNILRHAQLIDRFSNWCGGDARLLQIGDIIDRGLFSVQVDGILERLQMQAPATGGEVIRLVGNHELEFILGNFSLSQIPKDRQELFQKKFIQNVKEGKMKAAYAYKGFLCTHAGVNRRLFQVFDRQLEDLSAANLAILINLIFKESVAHQFYKHPIFNISLRRNGPNRFGGIFWEDLEDLITSFHQSPIWQIVGHTPLVNIVVDTQRQIIPVDVGLHRKQQYLEISDKGKPTIITVPADNQ